MTAPNAISSVTYVLPALFIEVNSGQQKARKSLELRANFGCGGQI